MTEELEKEELIKQYPFLTPKDIKAAILYAAKLISFEEKNKLCGRI